jgi:uncharacterized protein YigE (DUF2233 family)
VCMGMTLGLLGVAICCGHAHRSGAGSSSVLEPRAGVLPEASSLARAAVARPWFDVAALGGARVVVASKATDPLEAVRLQTNEGEYDLVLVRDVKSLQILDRDAASVHLGSALALREYEEARGKHLLMAMNGGMFQASLEPVGLLVSGGVERAALSLESGEGNFFMLPNGVFSATAQHFGVTESTRFAAANATPSAETPLFATQSGPLLLQGGLEHAGFSKSSAHRVIRNGVGVNGQGQALFAISNTPVTFHELARVFSALGFSDALYLDGTVSMLYLPELARADAGTSLGPLIAVTD